MANIAKILAALGNDNRLAAFEMIMSGETCACKIAENLKLSAEEVKAEMDTLVASGLIVARQDGEWTKYSIEETEMCLLNKYFNDQIEKCRSTGCKCKCGCC